MPVQTHIRSPLLSAAPISRSRRARAQEGGSIIFFAALKPGQIAVRIRQSQSNSGRLERIGSAGSHTTVIWASSSTTPAVTYFQKAISSFRANATISTSALPDAAAIELDGLVGPLQRMPFYSVRDLLVRFDGVCGRSP